MLELEKLSLPVRSALRVESMSVGLLVSDFVKAIGASRPAVMLGLAAAFASVSKLGDGGPGPTERFDHAASAMLALGPCSDDDLPLVARFRASGLIPNFARADAALLREFDDAMDLCPGEDAMDQSDTVSMSDVDPETAGPTDPETTLIEKETR